MVSRTTPLFVAAALLLAGGVSAQIAKGAEPPEIPFQKVWNDGPASFADTKGRVVILKFSESW
jgi:hypothetical protein